MEIGDLVLKHRGYGNEEQWTGIVLKLLYKDGMPFKVEVLSSAGIEHWHFKMVKIIHENR